MQRRQIIGLVAIGTVVVAVLVAKALVGGGSSGQARDTAVLPQPPREVRAPSLSQADAVGEVLDEDVPEGQALPVLLEVGSVGCQACEYMAPIIDELAAELEGQVSVEFHDLEKEPDLIEQYDIMVIPTQVFLDPSGRELFQHQGVFEKEDILAKLKELGMLEE